MHFALPPRKTSNPPPYARASARATANRRRQLIQYSSYTVLCILSLYLIYSWVSSSLHSYDGGAIPDDSTIVIVSVLDDETMSEDYRTMVQTNRDHYAARHGYKTFYTNTSTYNHLYSSTIPSSWALLPALRYSLTLHPTADYIWSLSAHALITNFTLNLHDHILAPLPSLMRKDVPVVPPDSVIHTFSHLTPSSTNLIISQDYDNIAHTSFLLRNTLTIPTSTQNPTKDTWTQFFLDAWFDPLYRAYAFQKAENHALEHIVQWHPTVLAKLVLVRQRILNSYNFQTPHSGEDKANRETDGMWQPGDLVVNFKGCGESKQRNCEREMRSYFEKWLKDVEREEGKAIDVRLKVKMDDYFSLAGGSSDGSSEYELKRTQV